MQPQYYKKLINAANPKNKSELEVYGCISKALDEILIQDLEENKILLLKSLIAYFEGEGTTTIRLSYIAISFTLVVSAINIAVLNRMETIFPAIIMIVVGIYMYVGAKKCKENQGKMVLCVLYDKLAKLLTYEQNKSHPKCKNKKIKKNKN